MLDKNGFKRKNFADLQAEMETKAKEKFGEDVNLTIKSPLGIIIWLFAWFLSKGYELAEKVYHSAHVKEAEGVQLDYLTAYFNTSRQPEQYAEVSLSFAGTANHTILEGTRFQTETGIDFALMEDVVLDGTGSGTGNAVCLTAGVVGNVEVNTITVQSEPSADVFTVNNPAKAAGGREEETDSELVNRLQKSSSGSGTVNAILSSVLEVTGVRSANISVNNTDATANGLPPHSYQVYVLGGDGQEIADAIFNHYTGIQPFGSTSYNVTDLAGNAHVIKFTPATEVPIFTTVNLTTDNTFPTDGATQVKDAIVKVVGGTATDGTIYTGLNMGDDVIYSRLLSTVVGIQGVQDASVTIGKTLEAQSAANIVINSNEVAQANAANIVVTS